MAENEIFQHYMPGDVCFGCGADNPNGLHIHSYWEGDEGVCHFNPNDTHQGWPGITCGGILATLVDCHCMATAMATAVRNENRPLASEPYYRFATGTMNIKYVAPTPNDTELELRAHVTEIKKRKYTLACKIYAAGQLTVEATVIGFLVFSSDDDDPDKPFNGKG